MQPSDDSTRILRLAAWIWLGFLFSMALVDFILYLPQVQHFLAARPFLIPQNPPLLPSPAAQPRFPLLPVYLFYAANGLFALLFWGLAHWHWAKEKLAHSYYPLMVFLISGAPLLVNTLIVPHFPGGALANAEGMALRQMPVLFVALALVAWQYRLRHVFFFAFAVAAFEWGLLLLQPFRLNSMLVFFFITLIRTISFIAVGIFINALVSRLREANARLTHHASTLETLTVSRERNRMARELHDTLAHTLTGLSVTLETVKAYWDVDSLKARALLDKSLSATRDGLEETRRALKALRASPLEDLGLGLALRQMAESAAARVSLDLELALPNPMPNLAPDVEQCLYRIAQEAVQNVIHHANAKRLSLRLEPKDGHWQLTVQDDGLGFDPREKVSTGHFGLAGMKERAELIGGVLKIESYPQKGSKIILKI
ncbi:MAG: hypothetical protein OHK0010_33400 [Anaerolineales bacterium]